MLSQKVRCDMYISFVYSLDTSIDYNRFIKYVSLPENPRRDNNGIHVQAVFGSLVDSVFQLQFLDRYIFSSLNTTTALVHVSNCNLFQGIYLNDAKWDLEYSHHN